MAIGISSFKDDIEYDGPLIGGNMQRELSEAGYNVDSCRLKEAKRLIKELADFVAINYRGNEKLVDKAYQFIGKKHQYANTFQKLRDEAKRKGLMKDYSNWGKKK